MPRFLSGEQARDLGVLQEVNRLLLHPRGMALMGSIVPPEFEDNVALVISPEQLRVLRRMAEYARGGGQLSQDSFDEWVSRIEAAQPFTTLFRIHDIGRERYQFDWGYAGFMDRIATKDRFDQRKVEFNVQDLDGTYAGAW